MRYSFPVFITLLLVYGSLAQKRIVVTSNDDVVLLRKGESGLNIATEKTIRSTQTSCDRTLPFGYNKSEYPCNNNFIGYHKDVWGQWFIAPVEGWIDSLYFYLADQNNMQDSTCLIALWKSNIYPPMKLGWNFDSSLNLDTNGRGPGWVKYLPPRRPWGYYRDSGNLDQGITPFKYRADDTQWIPTNMSDAGIEDTVPSFDPLGDELWGSGGFPVNSLSGSNDGVLNVVDMNLLPPKPYVLKGQPIFVTIEQLGEHDGNDYSYAATWCATHTGLPTPTRNWKFYNHVTAGRAGWHARGEATWVWSLVMTVADNLPPEFISVTQLSHSTSTEPRTVTVELQDCNPGHPSETGIVSLTLYYKINMGQWFNNSMTNVGGDVYVGTLPGIPAGSFMTYYIVATDVSGDSTAFLLTQYQIIKYEDEEYSLDTNATFNWIEINTMGTRIEESDWFTRSSYYPGNDDGTAGPIDMGDEYLLHGDTVRYAWIGVNGAVAFTKTNGDTQHIGLSVAWTFPSILGLIPQSIASDIPEHIVCGFYSDLVVNPPTVDILEAHGYVYHHQTASKFIIEWDSVGNLSNGNDSTIRFQLIFDNSDKSITFNYLDVGIGGLENLALVGMQSDTLTKWNLLVNRGNPPEMKPRNGRAFKFSVVSKGIAVADGWNMVSVPVVTQDYSKGKVFPNAISPAFTYQTGYQKSDSLLNGLGYWLKFNNNQTIYIKKSADISTDTIELNPNWNMIGSISSAISVGDIVTEPPGIIITPFFEYENGYSASDSIRPGKGYWIRVNKAGTLILSSPAIR